jgi:hypothetical protein
VRVRVSPPAQKSKALDNLFKAFFLRCIFSVRQKKAMR